jgi:hypothetical protein
MRKPGIGAVCAPVLSIPAIENKTELRSHKEHKGHKERKHKIFMERLMCFLSIRNPQSAIDCDGRWQDVLWQCLWLSEQVKYKIPRGVIGNTEVFGTSIPGSSPGGVGF